MWSRWEHSRQFWDNEQVKSVSVSDNITSIGNNAFYDCRNLRSVTLPDSLMIIGDFAFFRCPAMNRLTVPEGVIRIGEYAFFGCGALNTVRLPATVSFIGGHCFEDCVNLVDIQLPDSVSDIGERAFCGCMSLRKTVIPESVTAIKSSAFSGCVSLSEIILPNSIVEIEEKAFEDCGSLKEIIIPGRVKKIGSYAFEDCASVKEIIIPASLERLGDFVFDGCAGLLSIEADVHSSCFSSVDGVLFNADRSTLICMPGGRTGNYTIPSTVTLIGTGAFSKCGGLTEITIPDSVTVIGESAFESCGKLEKVFIPDSVLTLSTRAFNSCRRMKELQIPDSVETIGDLCFEYCSGLNKIVIPDSVRSIGYASFSSCESLRELYISSSVKYIGDSVFANSNHLSTLIVDENNENYSSENDVLYNRDKTTLIFVPDSKSDDVIIPDTVTHIAKNAFLQCNISRITIPDSVVEIGEMAFAYCEKLKMITIPDSVETIEDCAFYGCSSLVSVHIPAGIEYMGVSVFEKCDRLRRVSFGGSKVAWGKRFSGDGLYGNIGIGLNKRVKVSYNSVPPAAATITRQPSPVTSKVGDRARFSVDAAGSGLRYQWYYKKSGDHSWHRWNGHTTRVTEAKANASWQGMNVRCVVSDRYGNVCVSDSAETEISDVFAITRQSEDACGHTGGSLSFEIRAQGKGLTYQWFYCKIGQRNWIEWEGQNNPVLVFSADASHNGMSVRCCVSDASQRIILSRPSIVRLHDVLTVISQPEDCSVKTGGTLSFSVDATGKGLTYEWYYRKKNAMWVKWSDQTKPCISITADKRWDGTEVLCFVRDSRGRSVVSQPARIRVTGSVRIVSRQNDILARSDQPVEFSVKAQGSGLKYQWYFKKRGSLFWSKWAGRDTSEFTVGADPSWDGMQVYCLITDIKGYSVPTDPVSVSVIK
jgi:hypothetical protein